MSVKQVPYGDILMSSDINRSNNASLLAIKSHIHNPNEDV